MTATMHEVREHLDQVKAAHHATDLVDDKGRISRVCVECTPAPWPCDELRDALRATATAVDTPVIPPMTFTRSEITAVDDEYRARARMVAGDWFDGDPEFAKFVGVLMECRRGPEMTISSNDVRARYLEDTVDGPRIRIEPHQFSAFWGRARAEGFVAIHKNPDGTDDLERISNSPTGNNGKWVAVRVWTGGLPDRPDAGQLLATASGA